MAGKEPRYKQLLHLADSETQSSWWSLAKLLLSLEHLLGWIQTTSTQSLAMHTRRWPPRASQSARRHLLAMHLSRLKPIGLLFFESVQAWQKKYNLPPGDDIWTHDAMHVVLHKMLSTDSDKIRKDYSLTGARLDGSPGSDSGPTLSEEYAVSAIETARSMRKTGAKYAGGLGFEQMRADPDLLSAKYITSYDDDASPEALNSARFIQESVKKIMSSPDFDSALDFMDYFKDKMYDD